MATAQGEATENEPPGLPLRIATYLFRVVVYTPVYAFGFALVSSPFVLLTLTTPENVLGSYTLVVVAGWALYAGQLEALDQFDREPMDEHWLVNLMFAVATVLYYNAVLGVTVLVGYVLHASGYPNIGVAFVFGAPQLDIWLSRNDAPSVARLLAGTAERLAKKTITVYEHIPFERVIVGVVQFLASVNDAAPPILAHLSLGSISRRQGQ